MLNKKALSGTAAAAGWDIENATWEGTTTWYDFGSTGDNRGIFPTGLFFKPDGTKMYLVGQRDFGAPADAVYEFNLSTAWDITTASYLQYFQIGAAGRETLPSGIFFKPDGTKFYITGSTQDSIEEYDLSTAWDISTGSFNQSFSVATEETAPNSVFFKPDGLKFYVSGAAGDDVNEYDLSTAWDISTATYSQNFSVASQTGLPEGLFFKSDGIKMYVTDDSNIHEYDLSTAWDVSTSSFNQSSSIQRENTSQGGGGFYFKSDGTRFYTVNNTFDRIIKFDLSSAWDVSTASFDAPGGYFNVYLEENSPQGLFFKSDGAKMYIIGSSGDEINEYNLSTSWDITTASYNQNFSVSAKDTNPTDLFFKPDGLKVYIIGGSSDSVHQYNLTVAWDISTASFNQSFSVSTQETVPTGLFFKDDGTKMYICGTAGDDINEYDLSTAWDISTATYNQNFSVAAQTLGVSGLFFKPDGRKMWISSSSTDSILQYNLGTAWDISSASYVKNSAVGGQETTPNAVSFKDDGVKMYITGFDYKSVWSYNLV